MQIYLLAFSELMPTSQAANIPKVDENGINEVLDMVTILVGDVFCFVFFVVVVVVAGWVSKRKQNMGDCEELSRGAPFLFGVVLKMPK